MAYGDITTTLIDSWSLNYNSNKVGNWSYGACKVAGNVYVAAYDKKSSGTACSLMIETFACSPAGDITPSVIASHEEYLGESSRPLWAGCSIMKIASGVFGVLQKTRGDYAGDVVYVATFSISADGATISKIEQATLDVNQDIFCGNHPLLHVAGDVYALVTQERWGSSPNFSYGYVIRTLTITSAGDIDDTSGNLDVIDFERVELFTVDPGQRFNACLRRINSTVFGLVCGDIQGANIAPTTLHTFNITDTGAISSELDSQAFSTVKWQGNVLFQVKDTVWAVVYNNDSNDATLDTVNISSAGIITTIASLTFYTDPFDSGHQMETRFRADVNKFILFWIGAQTINVDVFNISNDGATISVYDSHVAYAGAAQQGNVLHLGTDYYLMADEGGVFYCDVLTFKVVTFRAGGWVQII